MLGFMVREISPSLRALSQLLTLPTLVCGLEYLLLLVVVQVVVQIPDRVLNGAPFLPQPASACLTLRVATCAPSLIFTLFFGFLSPFLSLFPSHFLSS